MKSRKLLYIVLILILVVLLLIIPYGILKTMVSLQDERNVSDCISLASGQNLCFIIRDLKILFVICLIGLVSLICFRKKVLGNNGEV